jgi:PGF-pre-PGF domain-containing protein
MRKALALLAIILFIIPFIIPFAAAYGVTFYNPAWNPQYGKVFELVEPDKPYVFEVKNPDIAITKITFVIEREVKSGGVTVYNLRSVPEFLPEVAENTSYETNEMKYSGFVPHDTKKFIYEFKVAKAWLEDMSVPRNAIALHAYDKTLEIWEVLPTEVISDDEEFVYFNAADDEGVHYLLIGKSVDGTDAESLLPEEEVEDVEEGTEEKAEETPAGEPVDITSEVTPVQLGEEPAQPAAQPAPEPVPEPVAEPVSEPLSKPVSSRNIIILVVIAIAVLIVILYLIFGRKRLGSSVDKELHNYIKESIKRGKTKDEVKDRLLDVGWHHERVSKALTRHKDVKPAHEAQPTHPVDKPVRNLSMAEAKALAAKQKSVMAKRKKPSKSSKKAHQSKKK